MSIFICVSKFGGCGYIGNDNEWEVFDSSPNEKYCPNCKRVGALWLNDGTFEKFTEGMSDNNRLRLNEHNSMMHGALLKAAVNNGYISKDRLTPVQQKEILK